MFTCSQKRYKRCCYAVFACEQWREQRCEHSKSCSQVNFWVCSHGYTIVHTVVYSLPTPLCIPYGPQRMREACRAHPSVRVIIVLISAASERFNAFGSPLNASHQTSRAQIRSRGTRCRLSLPIVTPPQNIRRLSSGHLLQSSGTGRSINSRTIPSHADLSLCSS